LRYGDLQHVFGSANRLNGMDAMVASAARCGELPE